MKTYIRLIDLIPRRHFSAIKFNEEASRMKENSKILRSWESISIIFIFILDSSVRFSTILSCLNKLYNGGINKRERCKKKKYEYIKTETSIGQLKIRSSRGTYPYARNLV